MTIEDLKHLENWRSYLHSINSFYNKQPHFFDIKDHAVRQFSGLGSLGVKKYYILLEGPSLKHDDDIILEAKEQTPPVMLQYTKKSSWPEYYKNFSSAADCTRTAYQAMNLQEDPYVGVLQGDKISFLVRRISPWKAGYDPEDLTDPKDLKDFIQIAAKALAYGHGRADKDYAEKFVDYNAEKQILEAIDTWSKFKTTTA